MHIRDLKKEDAPLMLEWMHDCELTEFLHRDFSKLTIEDAERFINNSTGVGSLHYAITSDEDEYMGTVSLKNIKNGSAEFGICLRRKALGCGYAWFAMESIVRRGFDEFGLESIYWCVSKRNVRAVRFYEKHCFHQTFDMPQEVLNEYSDQEDLMWFSILKGDKINSGESVAGCRIISIKTIPTLDAGELSFFEENRDIPFEVKRIYYISKVPKGARRGFHAHKHLKQLLFCPYGRIQLVLENGSKREEIELSDPSVGVLIEKTTWREMTWLQKDSVLCVAASDYYYQDDYIRDYAEFRKYVETEHV